MPTYSVHNYLIPSSLSKEEFVKAFKSITKKDMIELRVFEARLWQKYTENKNHRGDICHVYFNPINRMLFIGMEGTKFQFLPKDIPLPKGWKVVIRNIWDEKYAYEYPKGQKWLLESADYDNLEKPVTFDAVAWCLGNKYDYIQLEVDAYRILEEHGEVPKGTVAQMEPFIKKK